jgi:putative PEP-CTERM system histidine kinase
MNSYSIITLIILLIHLVLGVVVVAKRRWDGLSVAFVTVVMSILIVEFGYIMLLLTPDPKSVLRWVRISNAGNCFIPSSYALLTLFFWKQYRETLPKRLKYSVLISYLLGAGFSILIFSDLLFESISNNLSRYEWIYNRAGKILFAYLLCVTLLAIYNAERVYRQAAHNNQPHVRYPMLMLISSLSFHALLDSLSLMYRYTRLDALIIASLTLVAANVLLARCIIKIESRESSIYVSREVIFKSYTALIAGIFLLLLGLMGEIIQLIGRNLNFFLAFFVAFAIVFLFLVILISRSIRQRFQLFTERHFYKEAYDYRREWETFSRRIFAIVDTKILPLELLSAVSTPIQINKSCLIALVPPEIPIVVDSINMETEALSGCVDKTFIDWLWRYGKPVKINDANLPEERVKRLRNFDVNVCVPIIAEQQFLAILMLGPKETTPKYSNEDLDLLETMAHQMAIAMLNANRREELMMSRELEQFQRFSAFILHDVKNAVSMLSLVMANAEDNLDNPEFQTDMLRTVDGTVKRLQRLMSKLSALPAKTDFKTQTTDLEQVLDSVVEKSGVQNLQKVRLVKELMPVPSVFVDPEEIEKVIFNLLLNAIEALTESGEIKLRLYREEGDVCLQINDTGCGMSQEFIYSRLFKPFQTTKSKGLGIGLYQCKTIVEAHGGTIDVESEEGVGSCFTIKLPLRCEQS